MLPTLIKKTMACTLLLACITLAFFSCQKELSGENNGTPGQPADLTPKVTISTASGFITDENNAPVKDAVVQMGTSTTNSDKFGYFEFKNTEVVKNAAFVSVTKPGYFKGFKTFTATAGKGFFTRIKLIPKTITGNINAASGGNVTLSNGLIIALPANAVVNASTGAAYSGTISVAAFHINPEAADLNEIMPGDLRGINKTGALKLLQTYGMAAVELTGSGGELLQIASGKKATLTMPIPASLSATAPASIPLWYFDETNGLWKEEGNAQKTGNTYVGDVAHFTYWNCDIPFAKGVEFECTIIDPSGNPASNLIVDMFYSNNIYTGCHGSTDQNGFFHGTIPANSQLLMNVYSPYCGNVSFLTYPFSTGTSFVPLGQLQFSFIPPSSSIISGNLVDCANNAVTQGYVVFTFNGYNSRFYTDNTGHFSILVTNCSSINNFSVTPVDVSNQQEGSQTNYTLTPGTNLAGTLSACGFSTLQTVNYTINGTAYPYISTIDSINHNALSQPSPLSGSEFIGCFHTGLPSGNAQISFTKANIGVNSTQTLINFRPSQILDSIITPTAPIPVHITEYGSVGQFISGNFTGSFTGLPPNNTLYTVNCTFRVRRRQ